MKLENGSVVGVGVVVAGVVGAVEINTQNWLILDQLESDPIHCTPEHPHPFPYWYTFTHIQSEQIHCSEVNAHILKYI